MSEGCIHTPARCNGGGYDGCACGGIGDNLTYGSSERKDRPATEHVYDVVVLPDRLWATSEDDARAKFIEALTDDGGLIRVSAALDE